MSREDAKPPESPGSDFVKLLDYLKLTRGFDFSGYKLPSLIRRVQKRMQQVGVVSYNDYLDYLEVHPDEFLPFFNTILINVTAFFRDPAAWQVVAERVLPRILESKGPDEPIRCWSAGCASGEEAYTLAILLAEALGEVEYRRRVKIYATDVDEEALTQARQGIYLAAQVEGVPEELRAKYFERIGERYVFRPDLRRSLIFGRHDLVQDAAISRIDLLACRNTMMYFNSEAQAKILARFHFSLSRNGYLFLGKAETLLTHGNSFRPEDLKARIFQRTGNATLRERLLAITPVARAGGGASGGDRPLRVREAAYEAGPVAQIAVDHKGFLMLANERARQMFNLDPADLGRLLQDLEISYRPVELRSRIEAASTSRIGVTLKDVEWRPVGNETRSLEIHIVPLTDGADTLLGTSVSFVDNTLQNRLHSELERANQELETAYEELQSTNEELRALNDQIQQRSEELRRVNTYLHSILASLRAAVVVLNGDLEVEVWSEKAQELWGLRHDEVQGQPFLSLDIGLPVERLREPILHGLNDGPRGAEVLLDGINRRGRPIRCRITCTRLKNGQDSPGAILLMEEVSHDPGELPPN